MHHKFFESIYIWNQPKCSNYEAEHMQENIKISKIDKKETTIKENNKLLLKNATDLYLLDKCLKTKVHKMLERQEHLYAYFYVDPTISSILQA